MNDVCLEISIRMLRCWLVSGERWGPLTSTHKHWSVGPEGGRVTISRHLWWEVERWLALSSNPVKMVAVRRQRGFCRRTISPSPAYPTASTALTVPTVDTNIHTRGFQDMHFEEEQDTDTRRCGVSDYG